VSLHTYIVRESLELYIYSIRVEIEMDVGDVLNLGTLQEISSRFNLAEFIECIGSIACICGWKIYTLTYSNFEL
jgi:hypothetical protein